MAGGLIDRVGVRLGYPVGLALWSVVAMLHATAIGMGGAVASILGLTVGSAFVGFTVASLHAWVGGISELSVRDQGALRMVSEARARVCHGVGQRR